MTDIKVGLESVAVVIKGSFNPAIFSPLWLRDQGLIGSPEMGEQDIDIISRDIAVFRAGWLGVQVSGDGLQLLTSNMEEAERLRDVAIGVLRRLEHTPVAAVGINRDVHFAVDTVEQWHAIGDTLAPKDPWQDVLELPGMRSVTIWGVRTDEYAGRVQVLVEPSLRVPQAVYVGCNDHYDLTSTQQAAERTRERAWDLRTQPLPPSADRIPVAVRVLTEEWGPSMRRADQAISRVASLGQEKK